MIVLRIKEDQGGSSLLDIYTWIRCGYAVRIQLPPFSESRLIGEAAVMEVSVSRKIYAYYVMSVAILLFRLI